MELSQVLMSGATVLHNFSLLNNSTACDVTAFRDNLPGRLTLAAEITCLFLLYDHIGM